MLTMALIFLAVIVLLIYGTAVSRMIRGLDQRYVFLWYTLFFLPPGLLLTLLAFAR